MKLATGQNPSPSPGVVGRQLLVEDPYELCNTVTGRFLGQKTVRTTVHDKVAFPRGIWDDLCTDLTAEASVLLDQNEVDVVPLARGSRDFVGCAESGNASTNDDDPLHIFLKNSSECSVPGSEQPLYNLRTPNSQLLTVLSYVLPQC